MVEIVERESQKESWIRATSRQFWICSGRGGCGREAQCGIGLAGMGVVAGAEDSSTVDVVEAAYRGCGGGSVQGLWWRQRTVAVVEAA